ncbi:MAG: hypothetical protein IJC94_03520, partial [Oscillospiraceae bacterium]|nr:hypothetical protein [Oscillospiraceae bacterium]
MKHIDYNRQSKRELRNRRFEGYESSISAEMRKRKLSPTKLITVGYIIIIIVGTLLLMLPV